MVTVTNPGLLGSDLADANFRVRVTAKRTSGSTFSAAVDYVKVTVLYTTPKVTNAVLYGGFGFNLPGNATVTKPITVLVQYNGQVIQTWTTTAPAAGAQVKVGSYTSFLWNCPVINSQVTSTNYSITVDTTNAVGELNEQNNVKAFYLRFPDKTTFQAN